MSNDGNNKPDGEIPTPGIGASNHIGSNQHGNAMNLDREVTTRLILQEGPLPGDEFALSHEKVVIGRGPKVDFVINHGTVSGRHAFINCQRDVYSIEDLRSTNGTFLNGKRVSGTEILNPGDEIRLGHSIFLIFEAPRVDETMVEQKLNLRQAQVVDTVIPVEDKGSAALNADDTFRQGDIVEGDKISFGAVSGSAAVAIGLGARATTIYQGLSAEDVAKMLVELKKTDRPQVWDGRIPYLGLASFRESDAQFFFGRERLVEDLLERVDKSSFIVIHGPSGSGKSSLARAGLFPALRDGRLERSESWLLGAMQPKRNPIEQLAEALARIAKSREAGNSVRLEGLTNPLALNRQVEILLTDDPHQRVLLLVDQFEEIFTQTKDEKVRAAFIKLLTTAAQAEGQRATIIISLRTDFIFHCARYPELWSLMSQQLQAVGAMMPQELTEAITLPALKVGAEIDPELVSHIVTDMKGEPGALPLMSIVLRNLFEAEKTEEGEPMDMTLPEYLKLGGIDSALERHANQVFDGLADEKKTLAMSIFSKLVELEQGGVATRRTAILKNLVPAGTRSQKVKKLVAELAAEGTNLITIGGMDSDEEMGKETTSQTSVTLAHEKLIDAWPWLKGLINRNKERIALQNEIFDDASAWLEDLNSTSSLDGSTPQEVDEGYTDSGYLYEGRQLRRVEDRLRQLKPDLDDLSVRFIEASIALRKRRESEK